MSYISPIGSSYVLPGSAIGYTQPVMTTAPLTTSYVQPVAAGYASPVMVGGAQPVNTQFATTKTTSTSILQPQMPPMQMMPPQPMMMPQMGMGMMGRGLAGRTLLIRPMSAQLTHNTEMFFRKMDPQLEITIGGRKYRTTVAHDQGKRPVWQDSITHILNGDETAMNVIVWDVDKVTRTDLVGDATIPLMETLSRGASSNWYDIYFRGRPAGRILINMELI